MIKFIVGLIVGLVIAYYGYSYLPHATELISSKIGVLQDFIKISPVSKLATYEVHTRVGLYDDFQYDYRIGGYDTPGELDRFWSQITMSGWADVVAVYGYPKASLTHTDIVKWGDPQLIYYEVSDNNIDKLVTGLGVTNQDTIHRIVNHTINKLHIQIKQQFAQDTGYIMQAKYHAWCSFAGTGCDLVEE